MKSRKKQPVVTRQAILDAAGSEFAAHGYAATGIGAIVDRAELTKGALFHHFPDKRALALAWVGECLEAQIQQTWLDPLAEVDSLKALVAFMKGQCAGLEPLQSTAALVAMAAETAHGDPALARALEAVFGTWRRGLAAVLERGQSESWVHRSIQPSIEAGILVSMFAGFSVLMKCQREDAFLRDCATALEAYLETLRPQ